VGAAVGAVVGAAVGVCVGVLAALLAVAVAHFGCRFSRGTDSTGGLPTADGADASVLEVPPSPTATRDDTAAGS
jgi:hypothetical protein